MEAEWEAREPEVSGVRLELDQSATAGSLKVRDLTRAREDMKALLWLEYRTVHPNGYQYSRFCDRYRAWRGHLDVVLRQVYRAGEKAFVDYAGPKFEVVDRSTGEVCDAMVFVGVLGASN